MEIRFEISGQQRDAALTALAWSGQRDATRLMYCMAGGAALSLLWPFGPDMHGAVRATMGALAAGAGLMALQFCSQFIDRLRRYRAGLPLEPGFRRGLEPGPRILDIDLGGLRETGPFGSREIGWADVEALVSDDGLVMLYLVNDECILIPEGVLERAGFSDLSVIEALVRDARRAA